MINIRILMLKITYHFLKLGTNVHIGKNFQIRGTAKKILIGSNVYLENTLINVGKKSTVIIGNYTFFGHNVMLLTRKHNFNVFNKKRIKGVIDSDITIGEGVWISSGVIILGNVKIGKHSVIAAGSVVTKNVPSYSVYGGNPARLIKKIPH